MPGAEVGEGKEPWSEAAYGKAAHGDEGVAGVEGSVALVEEREMAGNVAGCLDGAEGADEVTFFEEFCRAGFDAGDAAFDFGLRLVGLEGGVW